MALWRRAYGEKTRRQLQRGANDSPPKINNLAPKKRIGRLRASDSVGLDFGVEVRKWLRGLDLNQRPLGYEFSNLAI